MPSIVRAASVALLALSLPLLAGEAPWNGAPFSSDPKAIAAAAESVPPGEGDAVVLLEELHYVFDAEGRATTSSRLVFRVVDETAIDEWSTVQTEWAPWYQERPVIAARVVGKDGSVHTLDPKSVTESAARDESPDIFSDNRILRAPLPGMAAGVVVEQVITYRDRNPLFDTGTTGRLVFGRYVPVDRTRLVIDAPSTLAIAFVNKTDPAIEPARTESNGRQQIVFEAGRLEAVEDLEWNLPYDESAMPYVAFSTGTSWQLVAQRYTEIVEKQIGDPAAVEPFLRKAIGKTTDRREIVKKALAAIQKNIRYAGMEVGEGSIVPRTPKDVLALKYGDCKDKATLLVTMLRAAGIPAHVALLNAGTDLDIDASLPSLGRFNHVIVRVGGDDPFWVDPTDEFSPAGVLPVADQDRLALVASAETTDLTRTPASESSANFIRETRTFLLSEEGKSAITEITEATGGYDAVIRRQAAETEKKTYRESMENYAKQVYGAEALKDFAITDPRDLSTPFRMTIEMTNAERGQTGDIDAAAAVVPSGLLDLLPWALRAPDPEDDETGKPKKPRTRDFVVAMPYVKEFQYRIVPPPGFAARTLPESETRALGTASLTTKYEVASDGAVLATLRFDSGKRRLTPAEMEATRKAVNALDESNAVIVGFDSIGWSKLNAGDIGGALTEFRRLAALHPKEPLHHVQAGRAYFLGGMAEAAREELRRAIALDAKYAPAHRMLGIALQHDLLAREFRKGFDLPAAIAEYRKAKELAPKEVGTRAELAKLLTRGNDGDFFSEGARLDEAIDEYKAIAEELDDVTYEGELLTAMAHAGRFDEMKARAKDVKNDHQRLSALVVAAAATEGIDAALREAASVDTGVRRTVLSDAFQKLLQLRLYQQSATLLDQASQGTPNATQVRPLLDMLRRATRTEDLTFGDDPKGIVGRLYMLGSTEEDLAEAARDITASWLVAFEDALPKRDDEDDETSSTLLMARTKAKAEGLPIRIAAEIGLGGFDFTQDGDDATGYRVRARPRTGVPGTEQFASTYYVVRENGRYVVAATGPASIGVTALHFAEKGELETARIWLNWAREELSAGGGDDPLSGTPFTALWPKGNASATEDEIRAAAASLLQADRSYSTAAIPLLVAARDLVPEPLRVRIDLALAAAYTQADQFDQVLPVARRIFEAAPDSSSAFMLYAGTLVEDGRVDEARRMAESRLERMPSDVDALRLLSHAATSVNEFDAAQAHMQRIIDHSQPEAGDYNNLAWNALFTGKAFDQAIAYANQAVSLSGSWGAIHTLAALYAEDGKSLEARTKLLEAMDSAGHEEPSSVDWYVLGRIAENYGATEAALAAYERVTEPKRARATSTWQLARRRVQLLRAK